MAMYFQKIIREAIGMNFLNRRNLMKLNVIFHFVCYYAAWVLCIALVNYNKGWEATGIVIAISALQT